MRKIKHKIKFSKYDKKGWSAWSDPRIINYLPANLQGNYSIIGSLPSVFIDTENSFKATIIHEFGHIYCRRFWDTLKTNKSKIIEFLNGKVDPGEIEPVANCWEEVFAFCVEYIVSKKLFPEHARNMDKKDKDYLKNIVKQEKVKGVWQSSIFAQENGNHIVAMVTGRKLLKEFPTDWDTRILNMKYCL